MPAGNPENKSTADPFGGIGSPAERQPDGCRSVSLFLLPGTTDGYD